MKKIRTVFIALAIFFAAGGAFATKSNTSANLQLYYRVGSIYYPVYGNEEEQWYCSYMPSSTCTYVEDWATGYYVPYQSGNFNLIY